MNPRVRLSAGKVRFLAALVVVACAACAKKEEKANVILYDFMGVKELPIPDAVILKREAGFIQIRTPAGQVWEHSGRYSVIRPKA